MNVFYNNAMSNRLDVIVAEKDGFTDCMLKLGAKKVFSIENGSGQLAEKLKTDPRVISMENTDIRQIKSLPEPAEFVTADVSFISLTHIIPNLKNLFGVRLKPEAGSGLLLVKPQFEAGREYVKKGIVKDLRACENSVKKICRCLEDNDFSVLGHVCSPIKGKEGNTEYFIYFERKLQEF